MVGTHVQWKSYGVLTFVTNFQNENQMIRCIMKTAVQEALGLWLEPMSNESHMEC
jgi:hypothetical protein